MLVTCQECQASISDSSSHCIKCGAIKSQYLGSEIICKSCGFESFSAYANCPECHAPLKQKSSETSARLNSDIKPSFVGRVSVLLQSIVLSLGSLFLLMMFVFNFQYILNDGSPTFIGDVTWILGWLGALVAVSISGGIGYLFRSNFNCIPGIKQSWAQVVGLLTLLAAIVATALEVIFGNPVLAGGIVGALLSIGVVTRLIWWLTSFLPSRGLVIGAYIALTVTVIPIVAYFAVRDDVTSSWPLWALMLPYMFALLIWCSFDLAFPNKLKPDRFLRS